ncbi:hypothetical protein [Nocardia sp. NPDC052112]|uniref:hypothetical protein n=1 Tax=Nocardia sp. NPDC052112 TaxID=3155646 RepID=UPI0034144C30
MFTNLRIGRYGLPPTWFARSPEGVGISVSPAVVPYPSTGTGVPGMYDRYNAARMRPGPRGLFDQLVIGGVIESAVNWCTQNLRTELDRLSIPAAYDFQPTGTHSWGYWEVALKTSWPVLAEGLGLPS